jgi:SAM-dependent methyltransferase
MTKTYSDFFTKGSEAEKYDEVVYNPNSYSSLLWEIERAQINEILSGFQDAQGNNQHLDFACGTGRITSLFRDSKWSSTGIDISGAMLERAKVSNDQAKFIVMDIINCDAASIAQHVERYDLITSFRFILNAEPALRLKAFQVLHKFLKPTGKLVFNNHGNLAGAKLLGLPRDLKRRKQDGRSDAGYFLSHRKVIELMNNTGFTVEKRIGSGLLTSHAIKALGFNRALKIEQLLQNSPLSRFGVNQIYIAQKA